jgi:hypothetical protein
VYAVVWVADDPSETDLDPFTDGGPPMLPGVGSEDNPGHGRLALLSHAYGPNGTRRVIEATVAKGELGFSVSRGARFAKLHTRLKVWRLGTENWEGGIP